MESSLPQQLKPIGHFLKIANEHDVRDPVVAYWARFHAVQCGLNIDKSSTEAKKCLFAILDQLDASKKSLAGNEAITNEDVAEAHIENYTIKLFKWADDQDKSSIYNKNVVKAFYSAGILFDVLTNFTKELNEELEKMRKYAKWRAAYVHNCLKNGEIPLPAPNEYEEPIDGERENNEMPGGQYSNQFSSGNNEASNNSAGFNQNQNTNIGWHQPPAESSFSSADIPQVPNIDSFTFNQQPQHFIPQQPQPQPNRQPESNSNNYSSSTTSTTAVSTSIPVEGISKAQKYCKFATNALNFDDVPTAIDNLEKALNLLKYGKE